MAKVWFVREGPNPTRDKPEHTLPLEQCIDKLGLAKFDWLHGLDRTPRFGSPTPRSRRVAGYRHVVCQVDELEASEQGWMAGYYLLEISPEEVRERLGPPEAG